MTVALTTNPGGIFTRLGRYTNGVLSLAKFLGSSDISAGGLIALDIIVQHIQAQFESADQSVIAGLYAAEAKVRSAQWDGFLSEISSEAQNAVMAMVDDDTVLFPKSLSNAVAILIAQMKTASQTIKGNVTSASTAIGGSNVGNAVVRASTVGRAGTTRQYVNPEVLTVTYTSDSQSGATAGSESLSITGDAPSTSGLLGWDFPGGSGTNTSMQVSDPANSQVITDGAFEQWGGAGSNTPTNWTIDAGIAGTNIFRESTNFFRGTYGTKFLGDASTLQGLSQVLSLQPSTVYGVNLWIKMSATPAAGALSIDLYNGSSIIQDSAGTNNQITQSLTAVSTSWVAIGGFFRTPAVLPATIKLRIRLTTAIDAAKSLYFDDLGAVAPPELYQAGPFAAVYPGNTPSIKGDQFTITVANDLGGKLQTGCWRLLGMPSLGQQFPFVTDGSQTISESLVA